MPGGGQLPLVAYGNQNRTFNGNPSITHFYKVFKQYTHFSTESISIPMDGPNELQLDSPIRIRAKIPRHADLLRELTFVFRVPEIYSKVFSRMTEELPARVPAFRWIHMLGALIIDNLAVFVGGTKVQEFPGEWIAARASLDLSTDAYLRWRELVGDVPELNNPEWGVYGRAASYPFQRGEYPHTVADASAGVASAPSIPERTIRVPLPLWFSEETGRALPLVSLQLHEVEVQITLRPLRELYRIMDDSAAQAEPLRYGRTLDLDPALPTSIDPTDPTAYDNLTLQNDYAAYTDPTGAPRYFYTDVGLPVPAQDGFVMNPRLEGTFIYLTEKEQIMFAERELHHLVHQIQTFRFPTVTTRTKLDLDAHGLLQRLVFYGRRSDAIEVRNDYVNLSNWKNLSQAPFWPTGGAALPNSGRLVPYTQRDVLRGARLLIAGNELYEERPAAFFEHHQAYTGSANTGGTAALTPGSGIRPEDVMGPIYQMNFALDSSDHRQPSGTLNASRLREIQLEVDTWPLDPYSLYAYDFTVFCENLNVVKYLNGMAGLAFAI
jgi:hypothetical protein